MTKGLRENKLKLKGMNQLNSELYQKIKLMEDDLKIERMHNIKLVENTTDIHKNLLSDLNSKNDEIVV